MRLLVGLLWVAVACKPHTAPSGPGTGGVTAFVDVTVIPMDRQGTLEHQTVVVRDGKVSEIGPVKSIGVPGNATRIDGRGKWLIPGLSDMHVHTFDPQQLALFVSMGVTSVRVMWGDPTSIGIRDAIAKGDQRLAPMIFSGGPIVDGNPPIWPGSRGLGSVDEAVAEVAAEKAAGYDFVKVYSKLPADLYAAIVAEAAKNGMPVMGHVPMAVGLPGALEAKQRTIEHLDGYTAAAQQDDSPLKNAADFKARLGMYKYVDPAKVSDLVAKTKAAGTWNCPTLVVLDRVGKLDHADTKAPELQYVPKAALASWDPAKDFRFKDWGEDEFKAARDGNVWRKHLVKHLADAGAGIIAGTDVGNPWLVPGYSLHQELALLVEAKLTPWQALRAATSGPAELIGAQYDQGSIKTGVRADLVLLDADPLADIKNTTKIAGVMLRGRWLPAAELDKVRGEIAAIYAGKKSRFDGAPALGQKPAFAARYAASDNSERGGEQRIAASTPGSTLIILGETRFDGETPTHWEIDAGATGLGHSIHATADGIDVTLTRDDKGGHLRGTIGASKVKVDGEIDGEETLAVADESFGSAPLAADALTYRQLAKLEPGGSATLKLATLNLRPAAIGHLVIKVKRVDDATRTVGVKAIPVHVFELTVGRFKVEIALDENGWPVENPDFRRVE